LKRASKWSFNREAAARFEPGDTGWGWGAVFLDGDHDGDEDLYLANGWIDGAPASDQTNRFFIRTDSSFVAATREHVGDAAFAGNSRSVAAVDIDRDGDLDRVVNGYRRPPRVLQAAGATGGWVQIEPLGVPSNPSNPAAIGATVTVSFGQRRARRLVAAASA
jgi:hypothetical protein